MTTLNSLSFISGLALCQSLWAQPCAPVPKNLTAWFDFESASALQVKGKVGNAVRFDGNRQFLELPSSTKGLDMGSEDFSIEFWLRSTETRSTRSIVDKRDATPTGYLIFIDRGYLGFQVIHSSDRTDVRRKDLFVSTGRWHHVVATARRLPPQVPLIYVDGKTVASAGRMIPQENIDNDAPLWLARHHANSFVNSSDAHFKGEIDELTFYRRALNPGEILTLYRAGASGKCRAGKFEKK